MKTFITWSDKIGLITHLQVLKIQQFQISKVLYLTNESSYMHKIFTKFKPTSYPPVLQYYLEYNKPAEKFPAILDNFF